MRPTDIAKSLKPAARRSTRLSAVRRARERPSEHSQLPRRWVCKTGLATLLLIISGYAETDGLPPELPD
jgi:hypothetical protein